MTELEKYQLINSSESVEDLQRNIELISDDTGHIKGSMNYFNASTQALAVRVFMEDACRSTMLTRSYGIRRQAIYLKFYMLADAKG